MTPAEVYDLAPPVYHAFERHMDLDRRARERAARKRKKG